MCIKPEDAYIYGNYDSYSGRMLRFALEKCTDTDKNCKSEQEIIDFISSKYLILLSN